MGTLRPSPSSATHNHGPTAVSLSLSFLTSKMGILKWLPYGMVGTMI